MLASDSLRKLRSSIHRVVWCRRQPLACIGAVLSLLDGPIGCDPAFCVVWFRFRMLRRYLALWPSEVGRVYRLLEMATEGCPGHGPVHLLVASACAVGFQWDLLRVGWSRPGLLVLGNLACPVQHFKLLFLMPGVVRLQLIFVVGKVSGVVHCWIFWALCSCVVLLMLGRCGS